MGSTVLNQRQAWNLLKLSKEFWSDPTNEYETEDKYNNYTIIL